MSNTLARIAQLRKDLGIFNEKYRSVKKKLQEEQEKIQQLTVEKQNLEDAVMDLKVQVKTIKLAQALNGSTDQSTRELKDQINRYIREIDKCLQLINHN